MAVHEMYESKLSRQSYGAKPSIAGLEVLSLSQFSDDGGNFVEIARFAQGGVQGLSTPFQPAQVSMSTMMPGVVKAFHVHKKQDDLWFVPPQQHLLVNCVDLRDESESFDVHVRLILGGSQAKLLRIPAGVAHGAANVSQSMTTLFYFTSEQFNMDDPDEFRLPWNHFGSEMWELSKE